LLTLPFTRFEGLTGAGVSNFFFVISRTGHRRNATPTSTAADTAPAVTRQGSAELRGRSGGAARPARSNLDRPASVVTGDDFRPWLFLPPARPDSANACRPWGF